MRTQGKKLEVGPRAYAEINLGGGTTFELFKFKTYLASLISGISIRYFEGTHTVQLPCIVLYFISPSNKLLN